VWCEPGRWGFKILPCTGDHFLAFGCRVPYAHHQATSDPSSQENPRHIVTNGLRRLRQLRGRSPTRRILLPHVLQVQTYQEDSLPMGSIWWHKIAHQPVIGKFKVSSSAATCETEGWPPATKTLPDRGDTEAEGAALYFGLDHEPQFAMRLSGRPKVTIDHRRSRRNRKRPTND